MNHYHGSSLVGKQKIDAVSGLRSEGEATPLEFDVNHSMSGELFAGKIKPYVPLHLRDLPPSAARRIHVRRCRAGDRYLAALGITHAYCSPILQAARGSTHGYDVIDHARRRRARRRSRLRALRGLRPPRPRQVVDQSRPTTWRFRQRGRLVGGRAENGPSSHFAVVLRRGVGFRRGAASQHGARPGAGPIATDGCSRPVSQTDAKASTFRIPYAEHAYPVSRSPLGRLLRTCRAVSRLDALAFWPRSTSFHGRRPPTVPARPPPS